MLLRGCAASRAVRVSGASGKNVREKVLEREIDERQHAPLPFVSCVLPSSSTTRTPSYVVALVVTYSSRHDDVDMPSRFFCSVRYPSTLSYLHHRVIPSRL